MTKAKLLGSRGNVTLLVLFLCLAFFAVLAMVADMGMLYAARIQANHALNLACRAAAGQIDEDALADPVKPIIRIKPDEARHVFHEYLRKNMKLDLENRPRTGSLVSSQIIVNRVEVVNWEEIETGQGQGYGGHLFEHEDYSEVVTRPAVIGLVTVPVKLGPFSRFAEVRADGMTALKIHVRVEPEIVKSETEQEPN